MDQSPSTAHPSVHPPGSSRRRQAKDLAAHHLSRQQTEQIPPSEFESAAFLHDRRHRLQVAAPRA